MSHQKFPIALPLQLGLVSNAADQDARNSRQPFEDVARVDVDGVADQLVANRKPARPEVVQEQGQRLDDRLGNSPTVGPGPRGKEQNRKLAKELNL